MGEPEQDQRTTRPREAPATTAEISFTRMKDGGGESNNLFCGAAVVGGRDWQHYSANNKMLP